MSAGRGFSALQRAENSSNHLRLCRRCIYHSFQCSSASRKFLKPAAPTVGVARGAFQCSSASRKFLKDFRISRANGDAERFSALQRAENSSNGLRGVAVRTRNVSVLFSEPKIPQTDYAAPVWRRSLRFSALQRAENSSNLDCATGAHCADVSVLFSEPKIPQSAYLTARR